MGHWRSNCPQSFEWNPTIGSSNAELEFSVSDLLHLAAEDYWSPGSEAPKPIDITKAVNITVAQ